MSKELKGEVQKLLDHNDTQLPASASRVGRDEVCTFLKVYGIRVSRRTLDRLCREQFGRKSWVTK